ESSYFYPIWSYAAGGLYSTVNDLTRWLTALYRGELLRPESLQEMWTAQRLASGENGQFSPGWVVYQHRGRAAIGHSGGPALADIVRFPQDGLTVVVLCNSQDRLPDLAPGVADLIHTRGTYEEARRDLAAGHAGQPAAGPSHP